MLRKNRVQQGTSILQADSILVCRRRFPSDLSFRLKTISYFLYIHFILWLLLNIKLCTFYNRRFGARLRGFLFQEVIDHWTLGAALTLFPIVFRDSFWLEGSFGLLKDGLALTFRMSRLFAFSCSNEVLFILNFSDTAAFFKNHFLQELPCDFIFDTLFDHLLSILFILYFVLILANIFVRSFFLFLLRIISIESDVQRCSIWNKAT